ncbi:bifunctional [glutamine synthetase] adenylyltransferase/[glutamine synthetase]-adenylyl-L-tyrosine phosphorylase [Actinomycetaceae bacterium TAE3-ERU4]|nr:bifunctional [glutamine synthetase] adenylyltransferase/[glutamine synthetase]-adenylyl-L-tyrosine phosphorylase [Actinomycetaceae bacterium TAE3-ERU4]
MREKSSLVRLRRLGFTQPDRAAVWLGAENLDFSDADLDIFASVGNPQAATLALLRLFESNLTAYKRIRENPEKLTRFLVLCGASEALADLLIAHCQLLDRLSASTITEAEEGVNPFSAVFADCLEKSEKKDWRKTISIFRLCYYAMLVEIASYDLSATNPQEKVGKVSCLLAQLVDATLEAALILSRHRIKNTDGLELAIISMGKCGALELNYISDVDVLFVADWDTKKLDEATALNNANEWIAALCALISGPGPVRSLWPLDTGLRPEGADGALVRNLESYRIYYEKWAQSWEFQALMKARFSAGNAKLGEAFCTLVESYVWTASKRPDFVESAQAMRRRVETNIDITVRERHLKLGPGGLRDVEFTVQLLQLVHGRVDEKVRCRDTLSAIKALAEGGYIGREDAYNLAESYSFLRLLEHRIQLHKLRRSHILPDNPKLLLQLSRELSFSGDSSRLLKKVSKVRHLVRGLHQSIFYRPLLSVTANLSDEQIILAPSAAMDRLEAVGYQDTAGALRHLQSLTRGITRRANIQRHLLPAILGWLALGPDPDGGLLAFRRLSDQIGSSQWYLRTLRDSPVAAQRLCKVLSTSVYAAGALERSPILVRDLGNEEKLLPQDANFLEAELSALLSRQETLEEAGIRLRSLRSRELGRVALGDVCLGMDVSRHGEGISAINEITVAGALELARSVVPGGDQIPLAVIAMGRLGGRECGYASDADIVFVHDDAGNDSSWAAEVAAQCAREMKRILSTEPFRLEVDFSLRPEGKNGPLSKSLDSLKHYYQNWSSVWERQALLRARPIAGDNSLQEAYLNLINPWRYERILEAGDLREIRLLKARMETERLPRAVNPRYHVKLGPGGISDVEWSVQLLQLSHVNECSGLRTTSTMSALKEAVNANLLEESEAVWLQQAWTLASAIRAANSLATGRTSGQKLDVLAQAGKPRKIAARLVGYQAGREEELIDDYLRAARHSREVFKRIFMG